MSAPQLVSTIPGNSSTGIPIGEPIVLDFDRSIDVSTLKDYIVLFGNDFDQTSGPDNGLWIDKDTGNNPFYLRSPGFKGLVDIRAVTTYYNLTTGVDVQGTYYTEADEITANLGHRVYVWPVSGQLAPDTEYQLHILGDPNATGTTGVSSKTVFATEADVGNSGDTGLVVCSGKYTGRDDQLVVEITTSGDVGTAKYRWYYLSAGVGTAVTEKLSNRRYRTLSKGLEIRFAGTDFVSGDIYRINLYAAERMAATTKITFTTNDGTYTAAPDSPSTPATSLPPTSILPATPGDVTTISNLQLIETVPPDGAYNVSKQTRSISILFDEALDATTINTSTIRLFRYPALGYYEGQSQIAELAKKITVSGQIVTVEF